MKTFFKITLTSFLIYFLSWFALYKTQINTLPIQSEDTVSTIFTTIALIKDQTLYLDNYYQMMVQRYPHPDDKDYAKQLTPFYLTKVQNNYLSAFPIITSIISIPVFFIPLLLNMPITWENIIFLTHISSSIITALSVYAFYKLLKHKFLLDFKNIVILTIIFGFATINFAMFSMGLWQYSTLQLFLILGLYFSYSKNLFLSGLFSGIAFLTRPTAILPILFNLFLNSKNFSNAKSLKGCFYYIFTFILGLLPSFMFFGWYNNAFYKDISNQGYASQAFNSWLSSFPEGFLGIWISPSKGILVFSPVFIFIFVSIYLVFKNLYLSLKSINVKNIVNNKSNNLVYESKNTNSQKLNNSNEQTANNLLIKLNLLIIKILQNQNSKYLFFTIIVFTHTFVMGFWKHWYGGYSFGYRMAGDVIPYLTLLLIPFLTSSYFKKYYKLFFVLLIFSVFVQVYGLIFFDSIWHLAYDKGFTDTSWLWSIIDSEWAFNFRRVLVKLGLLYQACPKCLSN